MIKVLNLYAGIGGNRKLWENVDVTAVENSCEIAKIYHGFFPEDEIVVADAHQYLLEHYQEFDFIWSSPPCPSHSRTNTFLNAQGTIRYPDMGLWQEIVFLKEWCKSKWVVENVISYYQPPWPPKLIGRHYFWSNFNISNYQVLNTFNTANARASTRRPSKDHYNELEKYHGFILDKKIKNRLLLLRNCVYPPLGLHILNCAYPDMIINKLPDYYKQEVLI